jgi:hypothetical protein
MTPTPASAKVETVRGASRMDLAGGWASIVCALHCAVLPLAISALPGAGLEVLDNHGFDRGFAIFVALFGLVVIGAGYCPHRIRVVVAAYVAAVVLLFLGAFSGDHGIVHAVLLSLGGALMATAHLTNRDGVRRHGCSRNVFADLVDALTRRSALERASR